MLDPDLHFVDELPNMSRHWMAIDYGTVNPTTWGYLSLGVDGKLYIHHCYRYDSQAAKRQKTDPEYSKDLRTHLLDHPDWRPDTIWYDPSAASFGLQIWRDMRAVPALAGMRISPADNEVLDGIRDVSSLFGGGLLKLHRPSIDRQLWDELVGYSWDPKAQERGEDKPLKRADHGPDWIRYAARGAKRYWRGLLAA
jgi:hypothetical protein